MSGPKCSRADLDLRRQEELRRQIEAEMQERRKREEEQRRLERQQAMARVIGEAQKSVEIAKTAVEDLKKEDAAQYVADEIKKVESIYLQAEAALKSDTYDKGDFNIANQKAQEVVYEAEKVRGIIEVRKKEEELKREMERQKAEANSAIFAADKIGRHVSQLPHEKFLPGSLSKAQNIIEKAVQELNKEQFEQAKITAIEAEKQFLEIEEQIKKEQAIWIAKKNTAEKSLQEAKEIFNGLDMEFVDRWTKGNAKTIEGKIKEMEKQMAFSEDYKKEMEVFKEIENSVPSLVKNIESIKKLTDEIYAKEMKRKVIVKGFKTVLGEMGFNAGAHLENKEDPAGRVIIEANHPSGQHTEFSIDIDTKDIKMNLEDGVHGADCVAGVHKIISGLAEKGVNMTMTDWGHVDPKRIKKKGEAKDLPRKQSKTKTN